MNKLGKRLLVMLLFVAGLGVSPQRAEAAGTNLLSNGGFESNDSDWYELGPGYVTEVVNQGTNSTIKALAVKNGEGGMGQTVSASANATYTLSGYGKVGNRYEIAYLGIDCLNANGQKIPGGKFEITFQSTNYEKKSLEFTTVDGTVAIQVYTYKNYSSIPVYFDEISLTAFVDESTLINSGFEDGKTDWNELGPAYVTQIVGAGTGGQGNALRIGTGEGGMGQIVSSASGKSYVLSGIGKVSGNEIGYLGIDCLNARGQRIPGGKFEVTFTDDYYINKYLTFTTVAGTSAIQVYTYKNPGNGYAYFDSIYLSDGNSGGNNSGNNGGQNGGNNGGNQGGNPDNQGARAFFDDFTSDTLNTAIWTTVDQVWGSGNNGVRSENVSTSNGVLCIRGDGDYASGLRRVGGCIKTVDSNYASGSYEVRMKALPRMGALTAMWTYYNDGDINHEIDIEMPGNTYSFDYCLCTDWIDDIETNAYRTSELIRTNTPQNDGQWHTYRFDWHTNPQRVDYYRDGVLLTSQTTTVPTHAGNFWLGVWFPNNWSGVPNFATDYLYVDYVKFTPFYESGDVY